MSPFCRVVIGNFLTVPSPRVTLSVGSAVVGVKGKSRPSRQLTALWYGQVETYGAVLQGNFRLESLRRTSLQ